ncbi:MAG: HNH endonuclease signature motif containing protein [Acidimicrobiia bacterium]
MFTELLDEAVGEPAGSLDEQLRASELALREAQARHAALLAVMEHRGAFREVDGHRSMNAYLRATCNYSTGEAGRQRLIARVCAAVPELGDALLAGRVGVAQVLELARVHQNRRTRGFFERVVPVYLPIAEQASHDDLRVEIDRFLNLADQDGAFAELYCDIEHRTASVNVVGGSLHVRVTGGDPIVAEEVLKTFEWFVEREFDRDVAERAAEHGDRAVEYPLARTDAQRRFDAVVAMARAARAHGDGAKPADVVVNVVADPHQLNEAFAEAELVVETPDGPETVELDDDTVDDILATVARDPAGFTSRRCETSRGTVIHPRLLLRAALTGYVRRVVVDSQGVVVDWGRRQRFFHGPARDAAKLLVKRCSHPGCTVCPEHAEVDHAEEWFRDGGPTDQWNANIACTQHNRYKSQARWRVRRDPTGRRFHQRADGTIVLPVGARTPDFTDDDLTRIARARLAALR